MQHDFFLKFELNIFNLKRFLNVLNYQFGLQKFKIAF
jgi:hypothetical protein